MINREIDRLVEETIFRNKATSWNSHFRNKRQTDILVVLQDDGGYRTIPKYSSNIVDAWKVVEKLKGEYVFSLYQIREKYRVDFEDLYRSSHYANDSNAPMAICKAALKTQGIEVDISGSAQV